MGFSLKGRTLAYHMLLFTFWQRARTGTTSVSRSVLREEQQTIAREVVLVQVTTSKDMYLLPVNTYNYQTANRKLKIVAPNIYVLHEVPL